MKMLFRNYPFTGNFHAWKVAKSKNFVCLYFDYVEINPTLIVEDHIFFEKDNFTYFG